jgi:cytochrome c-type biogenesis protein CcmE
MPGMNHSSIIDGPYRWPFVHLDRNRQPEYSQGQYSSIFAMSTETRKYLKFGGAVAVILVSLGFLAYTGVQESKSYYVTIKELRGMGDSAYAKHLRVAGNVQPGSIKRSGTNVSFLLVENDQLLPVVYSGTEAPPDTFKDDSQALADGSFGRDGVFHAKQLQAKCASKYAPQQPGAPANGSPQSAPTKSVTQARD